jgi:hypothetical protein
MMATMDMTAHRHMQSDQLITQEAVIIHVEDLATEQKHVIVIIVDYTPIWITGVTVLVMMDMQDSIVDTSIPM